MPKVTTPTAAEVAAGRAGTTRHDRFTVSTKTADGDAGLNLRDGATTVSIAARTAQIDLAVSQIGLGARCRLTIPDTIVSRANRFLSSYPGAVTLHRDWHTKTHGIKADGLRPVWIETATLYRLTLTEGRWQAVSTPGSGTVTPPTPDTAPSTPRKRRVVVTGHGPVPVSTAAQTAPAPLRHVANTAPTIDAATGRPVAGSVEPFPTAPIGALQPGGNAEDVLYQTWSGHTVRVSGNATGGRVIVEVKPDGLVGGALTADDMTRLNTALAGWDVTVDIHPRTGAQCVILQPSAYHPKRKYLPIAPYGTSGSGGWQHEPAGAKPNAGVPGGYKAMFPPVCGVARPANAPVRSWANLPGYCTREPGHPIALGTEQHTDGYAHWDDASTVRAAQITADAADLAEAVDEDEDTPETSPVFAEPDEDLPAGAHEYVPMPGLVERWEAALAAMADGHPGANFLFVGPSGSGKGDGAAWLAAKYGLPFTKIDAASITEPEAWFGTREVVDHDGTPVTEYVPSLLVRSITKPGVTFVDEATRARAAIHNIFLPLIDGTRRVTNPLTGTIVERDPANIVVLAANRGLEFTATYDLDIALTSRVRTIVFDYPAPTAEAAILRQATRCDRESADMIVRFASETRNLAKRGTIGVPPMSTREAMMAALDVSHGLDVWAAIEQAYVSDRSAEGGEGSQQAVLRTLWATVNAPALTREDAPQADQNLCAVPECGGRIAVWGEDVAPDGSRPGRRCTAHTEVPDPVAVWLDKQAESGRRVVRS